MKNIINNKIIGLSLGTLAILAFGIAISPSIASAQYYSYGGSNVSPYGSYTNANVPFYTQTPITPAPVYVAPAPVTPTIYSSTSTGRKTTTAKATTTPTVTTEDVSDLGANVVYGTNGFLPSGIVGWVLFAILILIIVILVRKISGKDKDYHSTPLKHA